MVEDLKEGQPDVNILKRRMPHRSRRVTATDSMKVIRLRSWLAYLDDHQISKNHEGPKIHIGFVLFYELSLSQYLIEQIFLLLLSTCENKQRTSRTKRMQWIIILSTKEIQRNIQRNYPYQTKGQHSWFKPLNNSICAGTLIQRLSNDCLYKELKTWRRINKTLLFYWVITLSNQIAQNT